MVPASVEVVPGTTLVTGVVAPVVVDDGVVVPVVVALGVVLPFPASVPPARAMAAPHVALSPMFVRMTSVRTSICAAGTVNAVTAVVPAGTARVISTRLRTTGVPVVVVDALGV